MNEQERRIKLKLKSYDHRLLDEAVRQIASTVRRTGARLAGPVYLPNKRRVFTVLRSPHIDKKSRDQFELITHKRALGIVLPLDKSAGHALLPSGATMNALMKLVISSGVEVEIE